MILFLLFAITPQADVNEAIAAMRAGDYPSAYKLFLPFAENGDVKAIITLGNFYFHGHETFPQNYALALDWYLKGFKMGDSFCSNNIGVMFREGMGVNQDLVIAGALFQRAIDTAGTNQKAAQLAQHNLTKFQKLATPEQIELARTFPSEEIHPNSLQKRRLPNAVGSPTKKLDSFALGQLSTLYTLTPSDFDQPIEVLEVRNEFKSGAGYGSDYTDQEILDGTYTSPNHNFKVFIPSFFSRPVSVAQRVMRKGSDNQVRFESGALTDKLQEVGVVVTTRLPKDQQATQDQVLEWFESSQSGITKYLPKATVHISRVQGPWGTMVQTAVINRIITWEYPASNVQALPLSDGIVTLGLNRLGLYKGYVVEVGVILPKGEKEPQKLLADTEKALNQLMGSICFLE